MFSDDLKIFANGTLLQNDSSRFEACCLYTGLDRALQICKCIRFSRKSHPVIPADYRLCGIRLEY